MCTTGGEFDKAQSRQPLDRAKTKGASRKNKEAQIDWQTWWPFTRATGTALEQLNRKQPKTNPFENVPEALI